MKEIRQERVIYETKYQAIDGEIFNDPNECKKYENSALTVLKSKYEKLVLKKTNPDYMFRFGCEKDKIEIVKVNNVAECDTVKQMYLLVNGIPDRELLDYEKEFMNSIDEACKNNDYLIIERGYGGDCFWLINTKKGLLNDINKIFTFNSDKPINEPEYGGC